MEKKSHHPPFMVTGGWQQASRLAALASRNVEENGLKRMFKSLARTSRVLSTQTFIFGTFSLWLAIVVNI